MFDDCLIISLVVAAEVLLFRFAYLQKYPKGKDP